MEAFTGTKPVAASHAFDVAALQSYLQAQLPGFAGPLSVEQFKGGQSNPTYKLVTPGVAYVMRTKPGPAAKLLASAHAVEREFRVMHALAATDVPVPTMHLLLRGRGGDRPRVLRDGVRAGPRAVGPGAARHEPRAARRDLRRDEPRHRRAAQRRCRGRRPRRLRQAGQLLRAPDRTLEQAVRRVGHRDDRFDGRPDELAAREHSRRAPSTRLRCRWCTATSASTT